MSFLRIGTNYVVVNHDRHILLSQRGDLKTWSLPGGRLDKGEYLVDGAAREVREETGIIVEMMRPVGLYYTTRWDRMNVLFTGRAAGGSLLGKTNETLDNRFFPPDALPFSLPAYHRTRINDALSGQTVLRTQETSLEDYRRLRRKFAWRYIRNLLMGRPEPRYPRIQVDATSVIWDEDRQHILVFPQDGRFDAYPTLPATNCYGDMTPWIQLGDMLRLVTGCTFTLRWAGIREDTDSFISLPNGRTRRFHGISLLFVAQISRDDLHRPISSRLPAELFEADLDLCQRVWWAPLEAFADDVERWQIIQHARPELAQQPIWMSALED